MNRIGESVLTQLVERLAKIALSRAMGEVSEIRFPAPVQRSINKCVAALIGIDRSESRRPPG